MDSLVEAARDAATDAHVPYSDYPVGAAVEAEGTVYTGCNMEVANYSNSLHAEAVALSRAYADGARSFDRVAVSSGARDGLTPCGGCRQTLLEYCDPETPVLCDDGDDVDRYELGELLPAAMTPEMLE